MVKRWRQYNDKKMKTIQWQKDEDNTMTKRWRQYNGQRDEDNTMVKRWRQYNGQKMKTI